MRIKTNAKALSEQLKKIHEESIRKMEHMVREFVYEVVAEKAVDATPRGDSDLYADWYERRYIQLGYQPVEGLAKGSWNVMIPTGFDASSTSSPTIFDNTASQLGTFTYDTMQGSGSKSRMFAQLEGYTLGKTIYVVNRLPYVGKGNQLGPSLESGYSKQAPEGIMNPMMQLIKAYSFPYKQSYDRG